MGIELVNMILFYVKDTTLSSKYQNNKRTLALSYKESKMDFHIFSISCV